MKSGRLLGLLLVLWLALPVPLAQSAGAARRADSLRLNGTEYVSLADWAAQKGFTVRWTKRDEALQLDGSLGRIELQIHSAEAMINGVGVRLLFPLARQNDAVYLSHADVRANFGPILSPPKGRARVKTICVDPGHGGKDPGFTVGSNQEKKYALLLAKELKDQLSTAGYKVSLSRTRDYYVERADRPALARQRGADLFISLHFNATIGSARTVQGVEVYCMTPVGAPSSNSGGEVGNAGLYPGNRLNDENMVLAYQLQKTLIRELNAEDRGVHRARFEVLREATMPAVLIEGGFMSHPNEGRKIFTPAYRKQMARAIVQGVAAYRAVVER
jgi:N-acetylmuramoyl-L-alanine amidase